jgi:hypothetical protein
MTTAGRTDGRTDGQRHNIIRPVFRRAYKNYLYPPPLLQQVGKSFDPPIPGFTYLKMAMKHYTKF